jgi:hypothetical protein
VLKWVADANSAKESHCVLGHPLEATDRIHDYSTGVISDVVGLRPYMWMVESEDALDKACEPHIAESDSVPTRLLDQVMVRAGPGGFEPRQRMPNHGERPIPAPLVLRDDAT